MPENCYISDVSIIPDVTPYDSTIKLFESLGVDVSELLKKKDLYIQQYKKKVDEFIWNSTVEYDTVYYKRLTDIYVDMLSGKEDSREIQ